MPIAPPEPETSFVSPGFPSAFAALSMNSIGDLMSERYAVASVNSGLVSIARMRSFTLYFDFRNVCASRAM